MAISRKIIVSTNSALSHPNALETWILRPNPRISSFLLVLARLLLKGNAEQGSCSLTCQA
jgi:hypothetical protein